MCRFSEKDIDFKKYFLQVHHFHSGNLSKRQRRGKVFHTVARIIDRTTESVVGFGYSWCGHKDAPSRKIGREVAVGRAMKCLRDFDAAVIGSFKN